jgi:hypothetical protein
VLWIGIVLHFDADPDPNFSFDVYPDPDWYQNNSDPHGDPSR